MRDRLRDVRGKLPQEVKGKRGVMFYWFGLLETTSSLIWVWCVTGELWSWVEH